MKKFLLLFLVAFIGVGAARAAITREDLIKRVESCEAIIREFQSRPETAIAPEVLRSAKAIIILNQFKAGFLFGVKDGYGVIMVKKPTGQWSMPVLVNAGEASLGFQLGANAVESIYIVTDAELPRRLFNNRFNIGADAKAVAGPRAAESERVNRALLDTPMIAYTRSVGLYAGATVKAGHISRDDASNFLLYNTKYTMPELLYSDWVQPTAEVQPLMQFVSSLTQ